MMTEFLYLMAEEIKNNPRLANKLAANWKSIASPLESGPPPAKKKKTPVKEYHFPEGFDAFKIYYDGGSPGLYHSMASFSVEELKGVLVHFSNFPRADYARKKDRRLLLDMAVEGVKRIAGRSLAFGDYTLPE